MQKCYCKNTSFFEINTKDFLYDGSNCFSYSICDRCGSYYLKDNFHKSTSYNINYYSINKSVEVASNIFRSYRYTSSSSLSNLLRWIKPISNYDRIVTSFIKKEKPNILDYGSGNSFYINFLRSLGLVKKEAYSYDPYSKDPNTHKNLDSLPFNKIDLIISNQVFEHLNDPLQALNELFNLSHSKCELIFSVPVVGAVLNNFKEYSYTLQAPDHISILSLHSWIELLLQTKWLVVSICEDHGCQNNYILESTKIAKLNDVNFKSTNFFDGCVDNIIFHLRK